MFRASRVWPTNGSMGRSSHHLLISPAGVVGWVRARFSVSGHGEPPTGMSIPSPTRLAVRTAPASIRRTRHDGKE